MATANLKRKPSNILLAQAAPTSRPIENSLCSLEREGVRQFDQMSVICYNSGLQCAMYNVGDGGVPYGPIDLGRQYLAVAALFC